MAVRTVLLQFNETGSIQPFLNAIGMSLKEESWEIIVRKGLKRSLLK